MVVVRQVILAAFLTRNEVLAQTQMLTALSDAGEKARVWTSYIKARAKLGKLQPLQGTAPQLQSLPSEARSHLDQVEASDAFQENFGGLNYGFQAVPVKNLIPVQTFCNLDPEVLPPKSNDLAATLEYALPKDPSVPGEVMITPQGVRFSSSRYGMGPQHVRRRIRGNSVTLSLEHPNLVQVRKFGNTLVLANGTHRALEMVRSKTSHIPAIVIEHQSPQEFEWPGGQGFWNPQFLVAGPRQPAQGARPPLIGDFLTDLAIECKVNIVPSIVDLNVGIPQPVQQAGTQQIAIQLGGLVPQPAP